MGSWRTPKAAGAIGAASWGSLALAAMCGALATVQLGSQPRPLASASLVPLPLSLETQAETLQARAFALAAAPVAYTPVPEAPAAPEANVEVRVYSEGELRRGETLARSLSRQEISSDLVHEIATAMRPVFDFRYARAGDRYKLARDEHGQVV